MSRPPVTTFGIFCLVGAVSTAIDIAVLYTLVEFAHIPVLLAATVSLLLASVNGFLMNKFLTFKDVSQQLKLQYVLYLLISLIGLGLTLILLKAFIGMFNMYYLYAKMITVVIVVAWNFTANSLLVFKRRAP